MGQFKPMVKMETTEPSVELKLKKGGHVNMKKGGKAEAGHKKMAMGGGAMDMMSGTPALVGRPAVNAPVRAPMKPSMASRRKAMMAKPAMPIDKPYMSAAMPPMKKGGKMAEGGKSDTAQDKAMIKKAFKQHDSQEHKGDKGTSLKLKKGGMKQGGMATKGVNPFAKFEKSGKDVEMKGVKEGSKKDIAMDKKQMAMKQGGMATGGVTNGQGGYKTGGVALGNGGGYRDGGMPMKDGVPAFVGNGKGKMKKGGKMGYATGGVTLGNAGGFKHGGKSSKKAYATGETVNSGKPVAMPQGNKKPSSPVSIDRLSGTFKRGGKVKMADGGSSSDKEMDMSKGAYDAHYAREKAENEADRKMMTDAMMFLPRQAKKAFNSLTGQGAMSDKEMSMPSPMKGQGSVTEREKSITVSPAGKKRGGRAC